MGDPVEAGSSRRLRRNTANISCRLQVDMASCRFVTRSTTVTRSLTVVRSNPNVSPPPQPSRFRSDVAQYGEDLVEVTPYNGSLQSQNDYVVDSPAPVHTQTGRKNASLRVNRRSEKIISVKKTVQRKKVNCGGHIHLTAINSTTTYIEKKTTEWLIKRSEKAKEHSSTNDTDRGNDSDTVIGVNEKGSLESGVLDLSVPKNKASSVTTKAIEPLDLSVGKTNNHVLDLSIQKN